MWREYTRETPARRGLGVVFAAGALAGAILLAWAAIQRANPVRDESLSFWPVTFSLPERYKLFSLQQGDVGADWIDGAFSQAIYHTDPSSGIVNILSVGYRLLPPDTTLADAVTELTAESPDQGRPMDFGPFHGLIFDMHGEPPEMEAPSGLAVVGLSPDGLAVWLQVTSVSGGGIKRGLVDICDSMRRRMWFVPRPPWVRDPSAVQ